MDDLCLGYLLQGMCYRCVNKPKEAMESLLNTVNRSVTLLPATCLFVSFSLLIFVMDLESERVKTTGLFLYDPRNSLSSMGTKNKREKIMSNERIYLREVSGEGFRPFSASSNSPFFFPWFVFGVTFFRPPFPTSKCKHLIPPFSYCRSKDLVKDFYLAPFACAEVGFLYLEEGDLDQAKEYLNKTRYEKARRFF